MNVKEKWLAFSDIAHRVELNLVLSSLGAMGNCELGSNRFLSRRCLGY